MNSTHVGEVKYANVVVCMSRGIFYDLIRVREVSRHWRLLLLLLQTRRGTASLTRR
jgi:hypothetical protein